MHYEEMLSWLLYYSSLFELSEAPAVQVADPLGLVQSQAIESPEGGLRFTLNGSSSNQTLSARFLQGFHGAGVQHIALATADIVATAAATERAGSATLPIPETTMTISRPRFGARSAEDSAARRAQHPLRSRRRGRILPVLFACVRKTILSRSSSAAATGPTEPPTPAIRLAAQSRYRDDEGALHTMTTEALEAVSAAKPTRARLLILSLITAGTMINYLDRTVISVAAPLLSSELGLDAALMGVAFSAFFWTYAAAQIPGGILLDRFGVRLTYYWSVTLWSLCTVLQGLTGGLATLVGATARARSRRGTRVSLQQSHSEHVVPPGRAGARNRRLRCGPVLRLAFLSPVLFWLAGSFGWRALFVIVGVVGILFGLVWWAAYRDPSESRRANAQELRYIEAGGGLSGSTRATHFEWRHIRFLLSKRQIVGASIGQFASNSTLVFFLTWFPTYLATERQMAWLKIGFFAVLPFIAASVGVVAGGIVSDWLLLRTQSANLARKLPIIVGLALASTIVSANFLDNDAMVIAVMSVAFFGQGMCNLGWTLITDVAPRQLIGLDRGRLQPCANLVGIVTPLVVGFVVATTGSFAWALAFIAVVAVIGALPHLFVLGDVKRVEYEI